MLRKILFLAFFLCGISLVAQQENLNLVSWNIRDFGRTKTSGELEKIARILKEADVVAVQEVVAGYGGAQAVARLADELNRTGSAWDYAISDPTQSPKYVTERYAYLWKTSKIKIKNRGRLVKSLSQTVDREPYLLHFYMKNKQLSVLNFHARPYNKNPEEEIKAVTQFVLDSLAGSVLLAGDFNVNENAPVFFQLKKNGFLPALKDQKTTLKRLCSQGDYLSHAIDNIFYSPAISRHSSKVLDFVGVCDRLEEGRYLSDHLPVWLKFSIKE